MCPVRNGRCRPHETGLARTFLWRRHISQERQRNTCFAAEVLDTLRRVL